MSYTKLMIHDEGAAGTLEDPAEKTIQKFFEKYAGQEIDIANRPVKQVPSQVIYAKDEGLYPFLLYRSKDLIGYASDISALKASNQQEEKEDAFDMVRFSNDESWIVDQYLPGISTEIVQKLQAYMKHLDDPLHITNVWDDINSDGDEAEDGTETLGEHYIFIARLPNTWPASQLNALTVTIRDLLVRNILLKYYGEKGYIKMEEIETYRIEKLERTLKTIISQRAKPIRRRASFFH